MMPLYTSQELRSMIFACNTHEEIDRIEYEIRKMDSKEIPFEILKKFNYCVGIQRAVINNKVRK